MSRPKPSEEWTASPYNFRITKVMRIKLVRLGGAKWLREQIDKAKDPNDTQAIK